MKILIKNVSNTYNYGSMMMGENIITYLLKNKKNQDLSFYIETNDQIHVDRLISAAKYQKIYIDKQQNIKLFTSKIRYIRYIEKRIRIREVLSKIVRFYDAIIILGGDDYAETYYNLPKDNSVIKSLFKDVKFLSENIKVIMVGQTIGPYTKKRLKWAKKGFKKVDIFTRDEISKKYLEKELDKESSASRDLAFLDLRLQEEKVKNKKKILKKYGLEENKYLTIVGTGLISHYTSDKDDFLDQFYDLIVKLKKQDIKRDVVWLTHVFDPKKKNGDNYMLELIKEKFGEDVYKNLKIVNDPILPAEARIILGGGNYTISCRMHAAISTFQMGKPAICLSYSKKYTGVISDGLKCKDLVLDSKGDGVWKKDFANVILDKVKYVEQEYDNLIKRIKKEVVENQNKVALTIKEVSEIIFSKEGNNE